MRPTHEHAAIGACSLAVAAAIMGVTRTKVSDLKRFCSRRGVVYEFLFSGAWVAIVGSSVVAILRLMGELVS